MVGTGQDKWIATALDAAREAIHLQDLHTDALPALQRAVGGSQSLVFHFEQPGVPSALAGTVTPEMPAYTPDLMARDPLHPALSRLSPRALITDEAVHYQDAMWKSAPYQEFYAPRDMHYLAALWLADLPYGAVGMTGILLTRSRRSGPFADRHYARIASVRDAFAAARRRHLRVDDEARERRRVSDALAALLARPLMVLDAGGVLWSSSDLAGKIPAPVVPAVVAAARDVLAGPEPARAVDVDLGGTSLTVDLSRFDAPGGPCVVARLHEGPRPVDLARLGRYGPLSPAEVGVLERLAEGMTNLQIAADLHVSLDTVKTHVSRILSKLGVRSRTQATLRVVQARTGGP